MKLMLQDKAQELLEHDPVDAIGLIAPDLEAHRAEGPLIVQSGTESLIVDAGEYFSVSSDLQAEDLEDSHDAYNYLNYRSGVRLCVPEGMDVGEHRWKLVSDANLVDRSLITLERDSKAVLIMDCVSEKNGEHERNGVIDIKLQDNAQLVLIEVQRFGNKAHQRVKKRAMICRGAKLKHAILALDGNSKEHNSFRLAGEGAEIEFKQAILANDTDRHIKVKTLHETPHTLSTMTTKSVVQGSGTVVSRGKVHIAREAQHANSNLSDHSLLLDRQAHALNIPSMEVIANEVQAGHSASTTKLNEEHLFYLMSRGLGREEAKRLVIMGFLESALEGVDVIDVKSLLEAHIHLKEVQEPAREGPTSAIPEAAMGAIHREDFTIFKQQVHGKRLVYLDSAATAQKPAQVIAAVQRFYEEDNANIHRGLHTLSERATDNYEEARAKVAGFVGAHAGELIFTRNATEGLNLLAHTLGRKIIGAGDIILLTELEHHSNIVPWQLIAKERGAVVRYVRVTDEGKLDMNSLREELKNKPKILALSHVSNVLGTINPVKEISAMAHEQGAVVVVDGAQSVPHLPVDVKDLGCDALAFSGHKMLAPTGIGAVYIKEDLLRTLPPYMGGGGMIKEVSLSRSSFKDGPERFEAGTPNIAGAIGLAAAVDYLQNIGMYNIARHNSALLAYALEELKKLPQVTLYGDGTHQAGAIAFNLGDMHAHDVSTVLDECGVAIRAGHHCAQPLMERLGVTSMCRASIHLYNNKEDIDRLIEGLKKAVEIFKLEDWRKP